MSLWVDKYRPLSFSKLDYHREQAEKLKRLVELGDFPHLLLYGPSGAGKKTRLTCLLRELYGSGVDKLRIEHQTFITPSKKKIEISTIASNYHIEVNPSDVGIYDRVVIQELIKSVAQTHQLDTTSQREFKVILVNEADKLTKDAQHALRRTMEKYMTTCRIVLCCNSVSRIIPAIQSRCLCVRVPAPSNKEIMDVLLITSKKEGIAVPPELVARIIDKSDRNLRRALLMLEVCKVQQCPMTADQVIPEPDWERFLRETANMIIVEQTAKRVGEVRERVYELMAHCIPGDVIMKGMLHELLKNCDGHLRPKVVQLAALYEHRMKLGQKAIYHIEAFVIKVMAMFKKFLEDGILAGFEDDDF